jgi:moderate conductance mechanosensitive channel
LRPPRFRNPGSGAVFRTLKVLEAVRTTSLIQVAEQADSVIAQVSRRAVEWRELIDVVALTGIALQLIAILVLAWIAYTGLAMVLHRIERSVEVSTPGVVSAQEQRVRTLVSLIRSVGLFFIALIVLFTGLSTFGFQIGPLLAGAGVAGLAISFGAQSLVRDVISGLFILLENQFAVGDVVRIGDVAGRVEKVTLRIVVMRDHQGIVHIVPNGEIKRVSNLTRSFSRAVLDIGVAYKEDVDHVMAVMRDVGRQLYDDPEWRPLLTEEITVPGVESFAESGVVIRIVATTLPLKQWDVARELRRRLKHRFDAEKIEIPFPHRTLYWGEGQQPGGEPSTVG